MSLGGVEFYLVLGGRVEETSYDSYRFFEKLNICFKCKSDSYVRTATCIPKIKYRFTWGKSSEKNIC